MMLGKLSEVLLITSYYSAVQAPTDIAWVNAEETISLMAYAVRGVVSAAGGLDDFRILGNPVADGSGADVVLKGTHAEEAAADASGDQLMLEVTSKDLDAQAETPLKGLSASIGHVTAADSTAVTYVQRKRQQYADLTPVSVIA